MKFNDNPAPIFIRDQCFQGCQKDSIPPMDNWYEFAMYSIWIRHMTTERIRIEGDNQNIYHWYTYEQSMTSDDKEDCFQLCFIGA